VVRVPTRVMQDRESNVTNGTDVDSDQMELREKYRRERDKRLRPENTGQWVHMTGKFAHS
jgi:hypothetical protein